MQEKLLGNILLVVGILIMLFALYSTYSVFKGNNESFELFKLSGVSLDLGSLIESDLSADEREILQNQGTAPQLSTELVSAELINRPLNIAFYVIFMGFVANIGYKIASLGTQIIRPLKVSVSENRLRTSSDK